MVRFFSCLFIVIFINYLQAANIAYFKDKQSSFFKDDWCAICTTSQTSNRYCVTTKCNHRFHLSCLLQAYLAMSNNCPMCRADTDPLPLQDKIKEQLNRFFKGSTELRLQASIAASVSYLKTGADKKPLVDLKTQYSNRDKALEEAFDVDIGKICEKLYRTAKGLLEGGNRMEPKKGYELDYEEPARDLYQMASALQKRGKLNTEDDKCFIGGVRQLAGAMLNYSASIAESPATKRKHLKDLQSLDYKERTHLGGKKVTNIEDDIARTSASANDRDFLKVFEQDNGLGKSSPFWLLLSVQGQYEALAKNMKSKYVDPEWRLYAFKRSKDLKKFMADANPVYAEFVKKS